MSGLKGALSRSISTLSAPWDCCLSTPIRGNYRLKRGGGGQLSALTKLSQTFVIRIWFFSSCRHKIDLLGKIFHFYSLILKQNYIPAPSLILESWQQSADCLILSTNKTTHHIHYLLQSQPKPQLDGIGLVDHRPLQLLVEHHQVVDQPPLCSPAMNSCINTFQSSGWRWWRWWWWRWQV